MQWVIVSFPDTRDVYVDGVQNGKTNEQVAVGDGSHVFDLGLPLNYDPPAVHQPVSDTTYNSPAEIDFDKTS